MNVVDVSIESDNLDNVESKTVDSKKEKRYNRRRSQYSEFNTNAMIWANSANTQIGDTKILNNNGKIVLIEATENGYIEIESGNYDAVEGAKEYYETTNKAREIFDRYAESLEAERRRDDWSFSSTKNATYERRIAGLDSRKPDSNQSRIDEQSGTDNQKFSLKSNVEETKEHKQAQYELIQKTNPKDESINKYATWIDKPSDVRTFREALEEDGGYWDGVAPDFTADDIQKALKSGYVTVYSTYPIKNGVFVSPSRMEAESYGVRDKIHSKRVALTDVAWIDAGQGQYAKVDDAKFSTKDSEGKTLTPEQQEYFKDSKVRDEDGNLLKVYHGTSEDFTVFDRTKGRHNMDIQGSFFSPWELDAQGYGTNVKAYYLNITNPASEQIGYKALRMFQGQNNAGVKAREYLESLGYDGVNNSNEEYIAFNSNQIKLADNTNPTDSEDVRYSEKWIPKMSKSELRHIENIAKNELNSTDNYIDNITKWLYNDSKGKHLFALYSTEDENNPTILYASNDNQAKKEYEFLKEFIYAIEEGDVYADKQTTFDEILKRVRGSNVNDTLDSRNAMGRRPNNGIASVHSRKSKSRLSPALRNCLQDCWQRRLAERVEESKNSLKDDYVIDNNFAVMTRDRILREIEDSSAGTNKAYARRYITTISPTDYLKQMLTM